MEALPIVERICGACSVANTLSFCQAVEKCSEAKVPYRAWLIRTLAAEMERLYNHVGDTGQYLRRCRLLACNQHGARV